MAGFRTPQIALDDSIASAHFKAGSALSEFLAGRLGAPGCWPDEGHRESIFVGVPDHVSSIQRWENEGGKTVAAAAAAKGLPPPLHPFYSTRPLLTQLI